MDYSAAWRYLDKLQFFTIKLGLDPLRDFLAGLGDPHASVPFIHVAGTNGKGSVAATITAILTKAGYRVGLYTSPHLSSVRERFRIGERFIGEQEFAAVAGRIIDSLAGGKITYFEFTTALALLWFAERRVDLAVLEVGLGGRLDATNVVTPLVSVITNVSLDHEAYLGSSVAEVAVEKAGIIKPGVPVVSGAVDPEAGPVIADAAAAQRAPLFCLGRDFSMRCQQGSCRYRGLERDLKGLKLALRGPYQAANTAIALAAVELAAGRGYRVDDQRMADGVSAVRWPGRLETLEWDSPAGRVKVLLDGAHNPAGVDALMDHLKDAAARRLILVWASMADKDIGRCLRLVAPVADEIVFTRPEENRSATPEALEAALEGCGFSGPVHRVAAVTDALHLAARRCGKDDLIVVAGSLYLVGAARSMLAGELTDA